MDISSLKPYSLIEKKNYYNETSLKIDKNYFNDIEFKGGYSTFTFTNCNFNNLIIENIEIIDFEEISFYFSGCNINDIKVKNIVSENISIHFFSTIISGNIEAKNLKSISFNNCILSNEAV